MLVLRCTIHLFQLDHYLLPDGHDSVENTCIAHLLESIFLLFSYLVDIKSCAISNYWYKSSSPIEWHHTDVINDMDVVIHIPI